jgi:hypothetical protein
VGLVAEPLIAQPTFDFAAPRKAPDFAAARRQRALAAVFLLIVVGGGAYVTASWSLAKLRSRVDAAEQKRATLAGDYSRFLLEQARLRHMREWLAPRVDWMAHLRWVSDQMPDPRDALLDSVEGRSSAHVLFSAPERSFTGGKWSHSQMTRLLIAGRVDARAVADDLRGRLIAGNLYRVDNRGADVPDRFDFSLATTALSPTPASAAPADATSPPPDEGGVP